MCRSSNASQGAWLLGTIKLLRPKQWTKNTFVLTPMIFAGLFTDPQAIWLSVIAMSLFCLASSVTYAFNDLMDIENDRKHPDKKHRRPLASGMITPEHAVGVIILLLIILISSLFLFPQLSIVVATYLGLTSAYSLYLKNIAVVDLFTIAAGFILRVYAGGTILDIPISSWMFVTTFSLALFLACVKRRQELKRNSDARAVLKKYNIDMLNRYCDMSCMSALIFYSLFVMTSRPELVLTIPLVLIGFFRYWFIIESSDCGEYPAEILITDWQLLLIVMAWAGLCIYLLRDQSQPA